MEARKSGLAILGKAMERSRESLTRERGQRSLEAQAQADAVLNRDLNNMLAVAESVENYKKGDITEAEYSSKNNDALGKLEEEGRGPDNAKEAKQEEKQPQKSEENKKDNGGKQLADSAKNDQGFFAVLIEFLKKLIEYMGGKDGKGGQNASPEGRQEAARGMEGARQFTQAGNDEETKRHNISTIQASIGFINGELKVNITMSSPNAAPGLSESQSLAKEDNKETKEKEHIEAVNDTSREKGRGVSRTNIAEMSADAKALAAGMGKEMHDSGITSAETKGGEERRNITPSNSPAIEIGHGAAAGRG